VQVTASIWELMVTSKLQGNTDSNAETSVLLLPVLTSNSLSNTLSPMKVKLWLLMLRVLPPTTLLTQLLRLYPVLLVSVPTVLPRLLVPTGIHPLSPLMSTVILKHLLSVNGHLTLVPNKDTPPSVKSRRTLIMKLEILMLRLKCGSYSP
jgi:hypothetical protein